MILVAVAFALQMTAVTPLSASTSSQHLENQLQKTGDGMLASADKNGALKEAVLDWNSTNESFVGAEDVDFHRSGSPPNAFGDALEDTYGDRNIAYNVIVHYHTASGGLDQQVMVDQGDPSDHAVSASRTISLSHDDELTDGTPLADANFYAPDAAVENDRPLYNLVRVEVVAWRI